MCKPSNQTIFKECFQAVIAQNGSKPITNQHIREIIKAHGGCMIDKPQRTVLVLSK